ncbi:hypothetical protein BIY26_18445 [Brenneria goodwinii]|uniref:Putative cytochrome oxidase subunit n=1 Tax=Brenneria goodwinii TaxID=1109412 RepID=A0A0G4JWB8_9GAMM|nr:DUF3561 family protein [Brenneria goodwinii]ATA22755.1 hypothetical protein AWC36_00740 [Brenneria goodwinii]MCG8158432.1 DUF3561 family protein [Brenneria goodwinii]MCG8163066.1 DUF3561 family protein [Brenneria goodwinii]MCG8167520.1 DUF3561 family protein [Brenneria goodwinii]MCG8172111.1 DUF3561 family protein [Brenneria goodwinii]
MQNVTQLTVAKTGAMRDEDDGLSYLFLGTGAGFSFYCLAFTLPFLVYGANTAFFLMLYTWPFFLALMPLSIIVGVAFCFMLSQRIWYALSATGLSTFLLVWLTFSFFIGE